MTSGYSITHLPYVQVHRRWRMSNGVKLQSLGMLWAGVQVLGCGYLSKLGLVSGSIFMRVPYFVNFNDPLNPKL